MPAVRRRPFRVRLKPLSTGGSWCLITFASGNTRQGFYITYNGYVVSGTFASAAAAVGEPKAGQTMLAPHRR